MDKTVDAGQYLGESAELHELDYLDVDNVADLVGGSELDPGVVLGLSDAEGYLLGLLIEVDDVDLDLIADGEHLGGVPDALPAQLGNVGHAVHAADVDERAVAREGLDGAGVLLADLDLGPGLLGGSAAKIILHGADGTHDAAAAVVDLGDAELLTGLEHLIEIGVLRHAALGRGDEHADALDGHDDAALVDLGHDALDDAAVFAGLLDHLPVLDGVEPLLGKHYRPLHVVDADDVSLDRAADLDYVLGLHVGLVGEFGDGYVSGMLRSQIHGDFRGADGLHNAGNFIAVMQGLEILLKKLVERERGLILNGRGLRGGRGLFRDGDGLFRDGRGLFRDGRGLRRHGLHLFHFIVHFVSDLLNDPGGS